MSYLTSRRLWVRLAASGRHDGFVHIVSSNNPGLTQAVPFQLTSYRCLLRQRLSMRDVISAMISVRYCISDIAFTKVLDWAFLYRFLGLVAEGLAA